MAPAVSVVVATRNYGRYVAAALRSVLAQSFRDLEVLVIDDGSTDDTADVVKEFLADPRVRYHPTDGLGQSRAKNLGIQLAAAPLIAFLDADDEWHPRKLELQLPLFGRPAVGVVYSRRTLMDRDGVDMPTAPTSPTELFRGEVYDRLLIQNAVCFSSVVVRRTVFDTVGLFDPGLPLAIDYDLWLRVARHFEFDYVDEPLVRYRTGHANLSSRITERITAILGILRRTLDRRGNAATAATTSQAEAWGSTCRTMGYVLRRKNPIRAAGWYTRAALRDGKWGQSIKAIVGGIVRRVVDRGP